MRHSLKTAMIEATRLTRAGRLTEAMAAIRRTLTGGAAAPSESEPRAERRASSHRRHHRHGGAIARSRRRMDIAAGP